MLRTKDSKAILKPQQLFCVRTSQRNTQLNAVFGPLGCAVQIRRSRRGRRCLSFYLKFHRDDIVREAFLNKSDYLWTALVMVSSLFMHQDDTG